MSNGLSQIEFYFPKGNFDSKEQIVDSIISLMKEKGSIDYSGYSVGYWLVKEFVSKNPNLSWGEIMRFKRGRFLEVIK